MIAGREDAKLAVYLDWLCAGGIEAVVRTPAVPEPGNPGDCAALLLIGGGDVDPARYRAPQHARTGKPDPELEELELAAIQEFATARRAIFGICRGLQVLAVAMGGRLVQHVPDAVSPDVEQHAAGSGYDAVHRVRWTGRGGMACAVGTGREVNSAHHQAVDPAHPGVGLRVAAVSMEGVIEAMENRRGRSVMCGVQWHPERMKPADAPAAAGLRDYWKKISGT